MTIRTFRAGANGTTHQSSLVNGAYNIVQYRDDFSSNGVAGFDTGNEFDNTTYSWKPQAGSICWSAQAWATTNFGAVVNTPRNMVLTMWKDGVDFLAQIGGSYVATFGNSGCAQNSGADVCDGTNVYTMRLFVTSVDGLNDVSLDADPRHIWWVGTSFGT